MSRNVNLDDEAVAALESPPSWRRIVQHGSQTARSASDPHFRRLGEVPGGNRRAAFFGHGGVEESPRAQGEGECSLIQPSGSIWLRSGQAVGAEEPISSLRNTGASI